MIATSYSVLRENMKSLFDQVVDQCEPLIVTRKDENMVIMSQSQYDSLMETVHLTKSTNNYDHLMKSIKQHKEHKLNRHEVLDD